MRLLFVLILMVTIPLSYAEKKVAVVKMLRGQVTMSLGNKASPLKQDDWLATGSVVKTADKSFVRLVFIDKSQMNIGPNSEMKIEKFGGDDSGVIDMVKGKIRSQVSKDYLGQKDRDKSKVFIKTPNAVMGVRGTDFLVSTNGRNSSTVLFEGEVVFNKFDSSNRNLNSRDLESIVDRGVRIFPGEFSVVDSTRNMPTVPALMNVHQIEKLENNKDFSQDRGPSESTGDQSAKSVVPKGLSGVAVANNNEALNKELKQTGLDEGKNDNKREGGLSEAKGYQNGDKVKPTNGSYLHVDTGTIIAPSKDAVYDPNTNTFIADGSVGGLGTDGNYIPPKDVVIAPDGKVLVNVNGQMVEVKEFSLVMGETSLGGIIADPNTSVMDITQVSSNIQSQPKEPPNLCSDCGGGIPGSPSNVPTKTNVNLNTGIGDPNP
jgi:hypothetical protein